MFLGREVRAVRKMIVRGETRLLKWNTVTQDWVPGEPGEIQEEGIPENGWIYQVKLYDKWEPFDSPTVHGLEETPYPNGLPR